MSHLDWDKENMPITDFCLYIVIQGQTFLIYALLRSKMSATYVWTLSPSTSLDPQHRTNPCHPPQLPLSLWERLAGLVLETRSELQ